jgi:hypothetical protein
MLPSKKIGEKGYEEETRAISSFGINMAMDEASGEKASRTKRALSELIQALLDGAKK